MKKQTFRGGLVGLALSLSALSTSAPAGAAGLYFADRGVRPAGRAGAFIAGADDLGAIAYNPAGIFDAGSAFLWDGSWVHFTSEYQREALVRQVDPNTGRTLGTFRQTFPQVEGSTPVLPIPTIAFSFKPHKQWVVAFGVHAPYATLVSYPDAVNGQPAPQRYSLLSLEGSLLAVISANASFAPNKEWRIGMSLGVLTGTFNSSVVFSGCIPERFFCAPEDPDWDVLGQLKVGPIVAPTGMIGAIYIPKPEWRIGASIQLPTFVRSGGTISTRLPAAPLFERASQEGNSAGVAFDLPWGIKVGVENRPVENLRIELGGGYEAWGMHDAIRVTPDHVSLRNVAGLPKDYFVPPINIPRNFQDSFSARIGAEYSFKLMGYDLAARAGVSFETSAVPTDSLTVLTFDSSKVTPSIGSSLYIKKLRLDLVYTHVIAFDVDVDPQTAKISQIVPVKAHPSRNPDHINGGKYSGRADIIGAGLNYQFDTAPVEFQNLPPKPAPAALPAGAPPKPPAP